MRMIENIFVREKAIHSSLIFLVTLCVNTIPVSSADRPNILFVFTDDHCVQAMSCYGSKLNETPNMDRLAREGMMFHNCFVTNSICGPSRAVILTGKYSHLNGFVQNGDTFDGSQQTFVKLLQEAGYQTAIVGKWHLKSIPTGFDYFDVLVGQGPYYNPPMRTIRNGQVVTVGHTGYTTDIITDKTLNFLKTQRDKNKPFMLMYQHKAPHRNWQPGPKYLTKYDDVELSEPKTLWDDYSGRTDAAKNQTMTIAKHLFPMDLKLKQPGNLTTEQQMVWDRAYGPKNLAFQQANLEGEDLIHWKYQRYVKDYLRCVDSVDENLGRLLDYLDKNDLIENTVVVYSSDQGWYLGEHGWFDKRWMYEESLRTPLLVRWPGVVSPGSHNHDITSNLDFAETFLQIAGVDVPSDMQGQSLIALFKNNPPNDWRKSFYYHYYEFPGSHSVARHFGVRTNRYKLIHFYQNHEWELFDLKEDPQELNSLHGQSKYASIQKELEAELTRLRQHYQVPKQDPVR